MALGAAACAVVGLSVAFQVEPDPVAPPDDTSSTAAEEVRGPRLGPDGLAELALGGPVDPETWDTVFEQGCNRTLSGRTDELVTLGAFVRVETDGDEVVAVTLVERSGRVEAPGTLPDVWLGPTLGDPIADAVSLPDAEVVRENPGGDDGPGVTSVLIDTPAGQVVFADPPYDRTAPSQGRITHITVRQSDEVRCPLFDPRQQLQPGQAVDPDAPVATFEADGTADFRLGDAVADAERAGLLLPQTDPPTPGTIPQQLSDCDSWAMTDGTNTTVLTDDAGRVVSVGSGGPGVGFRTTFGLSPGQRADEAASLLGVDPPPAGGGSDLTVSGVAIEGQIVPTSRVTAVSYPGALSVDTIDALLPGPLLVAGVMVHLDQDASAQLC